MKSIRRYVTSLILLATGCTSDDVPIGTPDCIAGRIEQLKKAPVSNPPASVIQYSYYGQTVYYIPPKCCDIPSTLLDDKCNLICSPDGGFSGGGDGRCPDFFKTRTNERIIWSDARK